MASIEYTVAMIQKHGDGIVEELKSKKSQPYMKRPQMMELVETLERRLSVVERSKKWNVG